MPYKCSNCLKEGHNKTSCPLRFQTAPPPPPPPPQPPATPTPPPKDSKHIRYLKSEIEWRKERIEEMRNGGSDRKRTRLLKIDNEYGVEKAILEAEYNKKLAALDRKRSEMIDRVNETEAEHAEASIVRYQEVINKYTAQLRQLEAE